MFIKNPLHLIATHSRTMFLPTLARVADNLADLVIVADHYDDHVAARSSSSSETVPLPRPCGRSP
jgi:hypothetical protein